VRQLLTIRTVSDKVRGANWAARSDRQNVTLVFL